MSTLYRKTASVWKREEGSWILLGFLLTLLFVIPFLSDWFPRLQPVASAVLVALVVVGVLVVSGSAWATLGACILAGSSIALELTRQIAGTDPFPAWRAGTSCLTMALFMAVTLVRAFAPGPVTTHRIVGAITAYLLVGITWSFAYECLDLARPGSLLLGNPPDGEVYPSYLYFSFVTLTTVGYGEMIPISHAARALSNMESIVGILYPAVLIGRLLSIQTLGGREPDDPSGTPRPDSSG